MTSLKIVADENIPHVCSIFSSLGKVTTVNGRDLSKEQLLDADILLVRSVTRVNKALLDGTSVRFVATATIGTDHLDKQYLKSRDISWACAPGSNADSVVDYVISACCRLDGLLEWLLADGIVGIVGMGNVGGRLYERLDRLGIKVSAYDPLIEQDRYSVLTSLDEVLMADVICLHAPLTRDGDYPSYHLFDAECLDSINTGAVLINAGRGSVIDNASLKQLLERRDDFCAVLDVWEGEPAIDIDLLKRIDLATPHIAGYSFDGKLAGTEMIYEACCQFLGTEIDVIENSVRDTLSITLSKLNNPVEAMREAVLACYDIAKDDQNLRGRLLHVDATNRSKEFDDLRKNYPVRREFSKCHIANWAELDDVVLLGLAALGFICE
jgi:erythronate-4-phosphate dehydrogenase